jgi:hypothetical protein
MFNLGLVQIRRPQKLFGFAAIASLGLVVVAARSAVSASALAPVATDSIADTQAGETTVSNLFNLIEDAVNTVEQVDQLLEQITQPSSESIEHVEAVDETADLESIEEASNQAGDEDLYQELAKRSDETHEEWWDRVEPTILYMPGEDYRAWKATLSDEDREAYDAVTRQRNYERTQQAEELLPLLIEEALRDDRPARPNSCNYVEDGSAACQQR